MNAIIALYESLAPFKHLPMLIWDLLMVLVGVLVLVLNIVLLPIIFWRKYNAVKARRAAPRKAATSRSFRAC